MKNIVKKTSTFTALLAFVLLAGCVAIEAVEGPFDVQKTYTVNLGKKWTAFPVDSRTNLQELTIDGLALNVLILGASIKDSDALFYTSDSKKPLPRFRSDMTDSELVEFIEDSFAYGGLKDINLGNIGPASFGNEQGVWFEFDAATARGLNLKGMGKAAIRRGELHFVVYSGPTEYYFDLHAAEARRVIDSIQFLQSASG